MFTPTTVVLLLLCTAMVVAIFLAKRKFANTSLQEARMDAGSVRVPESIERHAPKPKIKGLWAIIIAVPIGLIILGFWFIANIDNGYAAFVLMRNGQEATATVTLKDIGNDHCQYEFKVGKDTFKGRGPAGSTEGSTLQVLYDPAKPSRNRPADGLVWDLLDVAIPIGLVVLFILGLVNERKENRVRKALRQRMRQQLAAGDFDAAERTFCSIFSGPFVPPITGFAEHVVEVACARGDQQLFQAAMEEMQALIARTDDTAVKRELEAYVKELEASAKICQQHADELPEAGHPPEA